MKRISFSACLNPENSRILFALISPMPSMFFKRCGLEVNMDRASPKVSIRILAWTGPIFGTSDKAILYRRSGATGTKIKSGRFYSMYQKTCEPGILLAYYPHLCSPVQSSSFFRFIFSHRFCLSISLG